MLPADLEPDPLEPTRRSFLSACGLGLGALAAGELLAEEALGRRPPREGRARQILWIQLSGAPPQHDLLDPKPRLQELHGSPCPESMLAGRRFAFIQGHPTLLGSPHGSLRAGREGVEIGALLPHFASVLDEVCLVRSMSTQEFNHAPADLFLFTGSPQPGSASLGSWVGYGLGSLARELPDFAVLVSGGSDPTGGKGLWSSGYLPPELQGVRLRSQGDPVLYVSDPPGLPRALRRRSLDALRRLNELEREQSADPETRARIEQYELAFRMQSSVPEVMDIAQEPEPVLEAYGATPGRASFANHCLLARRLLQAGVRTVQLHDWGWDLHGTGPGDDLETALPRKCAETDRPIAALLRELRAEGLLDQVLVVCAGEFGRTPMNERRDGSTYLGRDHHPDCFSIWLSGAGVQRGRVIGETDELGYQVVSGKAGVHDLQATVLHLLGLDPFRLSHPYQGLDQRLIGPAHGPRVMREWLS
jgi:hypothetical protein